MPATIPGTQRPPNSATPKLHVVPNSSTREEAVKLTGSSLEVGEVLSAVRRGAEAVLSGPHGGFYPILKITGTTLGCLESDLTAAAKSPPGVVAPSLIFQIAANASFGKYLGDAARNAHAELAASGSDKPEVWGFLGNARRYHGVHARALELVRVPSGRNLGPRIAGIVEQAATAANALADSALQLGAATRSGPALVGTGAAISGDISATANPIITTTE